MTFLAPAQDKDSRINGIRKWDQAFRVYAAIYCEANPERSSEIWQYVYVINSAANSFAWDNVSYYDTTFRQMMGDRPKRKWSKTYVQLWQLAMRDPVQKGGNNSKFNNPGGGMGSKNHDAQSSNSAGGSGKVKSWRDNCCWKFNKFGKCDRAKCGFDNHCSYCGGWTHYASICRKKEAAAVKGSQSSQSTATSK